MLENEFVLGQPLLFHYNMHIIIEIFSLKFILSTPMRVCLLLSLIVFHHLTF